MRLDLGLARSAVFPMPPSSSSVGLRKRLRSLTSLRPPRRSLTDLSIRLDSPYRVYGPADLVTGSVNLTVERPLTLTHLTVSLLGQVVLYSDSRRKEKSPNAVNVCRDELVLCGDGRLEAGVYQFRFELEFAGQTLPTSLDFEKGTIGYDVYATLTRPTGMQPTQTTSTRIQFMDSVDIAYLTPPNPQYIALNPVSRKSSTALGKTRSGSYSPSLASCASSPASSIDGNLHSSASLTSSCSKEKQPITATIEVGKAGVVRGDTIPVRVSVQHTKRIKSLNGIILTLFRQTRFTPSDNDSDLDIKAAYSPGGGVFRKDLAQTIAPLIIDPTTLSAVVSANLRVPDDVFPTIRNIPGRGVEFLYFVEVVIDLGGKLNGLGELFPDGIPRDSKGETTRPTAMVETERLRRRREKSVVSSRFEVCVGSVDSIGRKGKRVAAVEAENVVVEEGRQVEEIPSEAPEYQHDISTPTVEEPLPYLPPAQVENEKAQQRRAQTALLEGDPPEAGSAAPEYDIPYPPAVPQENEKDHLRRIGDALLESDPPLAGPSGLGISPSSSSLPAAPEYSSSLSAPAESEKEMEQRRGEVLLESDPPGDGPSAAPEYYSSPSASEPGPSGAAPEYFSSPIEAGSSADAHAEKNRLQSAADALLESEPPGQDTAEEDSEDADSERTRSLHADVDSELSFSPASSTDDGVRVDIEEEERLPVYQR